MNSRQKKITATAVAVLLVLALGLAGTFAASSSTDSSGNIEDTVETSMVLHDDFSKTWSDNVMDRDVYVENTGDSSLYVRIRLDEFMKYGNKILAGVGGTKENTSKWKPHIPTGNNVSECDTEVHDYFMLQMGNETGVKYKPGVKNAYNPSLTDADKTETTSAAKIILIEDYLKAKEKPDPCWVLDPADGYAYWYTQLKKNKATGLILNSITDTELIDESYYYGINAKAEAVTELDLNAWFWGQAPKDSTTGEAFDQASTNAIRLLKNMSPKYIEITQDMKDNGASDFDSDNDGYLTKEENSDYEAEKGVTPDPDAGLNNVQKKVKATDTGGTVTIDNTADTYGASTDWIVLSKNENEATLISANQVTARMYHTAQPYPQWKKSDLRAWLNGENCPDSGNDYSTGNGYIDIINTDMKAVLKTETLKTARAYDNWGTMDTSSDRIYLLTEKAEGIGEVSKNPDEAPLMTESQMKCALETADGITDSAADAVTGESRWWWLRSPRTSSTFPDSRAANVICTDGVINPSGYIVNTTTIGVRPTVTIRLK